MVPDDAGQDNAHPFFVGLGGRRGKWFYDDDPRRRRSRFRVVGQLADAAGDENADVDFLSVARARC